MTAAIHDNPAWSAARPALSVLIPFLRDDPDALIALLEREADGLNGAAEAILLDDGTGDAALTARLIARINASALPIRLISLSRNEGRSIGRNRLATAARGSSLLFLDSDMRPDHDRFVQTWADLARAGETAVAFGGFSLLQAPDDARFAVHRSMAARSDCIAADQRALQPEKYVFTSNLLVRRDVFEAEAFDPGFSGWGWEDVEWAMRVSRRFQVEHIDNPATHMGLDTVETLAAKYEQSAPNFARVVAKHPDFVAAYPSYRVARRLQAVPGLKTIRPLFRQAARTSILPVGLRAFSLRLYRVALYAEAI
ncbi:MULTISPECIES: glycosyltransferase family 2 protein [unclassified Brevundimonas]|uniref:glycosyltransferase family 2 protein n=1 Tax=unclassified Brevundimonas TaxID=2622653 RepID=UPI000CFB1689|nr:MULTISPECIES: glycosyltransferase family 2 protein [unclassified Brevundimonas]PRA34435.1 glycosyl transferase [Brevundimonas sp. MYb27]PQZ84135.1 glycosyl transferase [Brevundimonas sp. MYb31]PRB17892.1 glycosyl transferase [Brevundimonas sp. MYb52]PRB38263.1 glycosyl transferase [Brevundimonas sp. MYb46]PRB55956.1 glycosyl transferase [Brevundimonas sp. MYb33]